MPSSLRPTIPPTTAPAVPAGPLPGRLLSRATRRAFLRGGAAAGLATVLAACGGDGGEQAAGGSGGGGGDGGGWSFTDDRGKTAELERRPERVVAYVSVAAALWDYGLRPVGTFGPLTTPDGSVDPQAGSIDPDEVESVGNVFGEFNVDALANLAPDLVTTATPIPDDLWYIPDDAVEQVRQLAPIVLLKFAGRPLPETLARFAELATSLGADEGVIAEQRDRFEQASADLEAAAAEWPELKVMGVSGSPDQFYVVNTPAHADLSYLAELGVGMVAPDGVPESEFFEPLSWEQAGKYAADVIMYDNRTGNLTLEQYLDKPTFGRLPAARADQVIPWHAEAHFSYANYAAILEKLTSTLSGMKVVA